MYLNIIFQRTSLKGCKFHLVLILKWQAKHVAFSRRCVLE